MLVEDLLKNHSISELRELVISLEHDAISKQKELQQMVGSKYIDFIQSADLISLMQAKSIELEDKLQKFWKSSENIIAVTNLLLENSKKSTSTVGSNDRIVVEVGCAKVWRCLENCDIFGASRVLCLAQLILNYDPRQAYRQELKQRRSVRVYFSSDIQNILRQSDNFHNLVKQASSTVFLLETVMNDSQMILVSDYMASIDTPVNAATPSTNEILTSSYADKAEVIASAGLLAGIAGPELLRWFLTSPTRVLDDVAVIFDRALKLDDIETAASVLESAAHLMQKTVLDTYFLFFKLIDLPSLADSGDSKLSSSSSVTRELGLASLFRNLMLRSTKDALQLLIQSNQARFTGTHFNDVDINLTEEECQMRAVFQVWLSEESTRFGMRCESLLQKMDSATDVALLQHRIFTLCANPNPASNRSCNPNQASSPLNPIPANIIEDLYRILNAGIDSIGIELSISIQWRRQLATLASGLWNAACSSLLTSSVKSQTGFGSKLKVEENDIDSTTLLWSLVFRRPFMHQVERLLAQSCDKVLEDFTTALVQGLGGMNISVNSQTYDVATMDPSLGVAKTNTKPFECAHYLRQLLESSLDTLFNDIVMPIEEGDPHCSSTLARTLRVYCSQLIGRALLMIRRVGTALSQSLNDYKKNSKGKPNPQSIIPLREGLLMLGRFSWLLKIEGRFLENALSNSGVTDDQQRSLYRELCSDEQLRSAFEIADTDGDGLTTYDEAVEALQALPWSSTVEMEASFLNAKLTPSLTLPELTLLAAPLIRPSPHLPTTLLDQATDRLLDLTLSPALLAVVEDINPNFSQDITREVMSSELTYHWVTEEVEVADPDEVAAAIIKERVFYPADITPTLLAFLCGCCYAHDASLLSTDSIIQLHHQALLFHSVRSCSFWTQSTSVSPNSSLAEATMDLTYRYAIDVVLKAYSQLLESCSNLSDDSTLAIGEERTQQLALQCIFDLQFCSLLSLSKSSSCIALAQRWRLLLDPVDAELLVPLVETAAAAIAPKMSILLPLGKSFTRPSSSVSRDSPLFPAQTYPCHFSPLPLPLSSQALAQSSLTSLRPNRSLDNTMKSIAKPKEVESESSKDGSKLDLKTLYGYGVSSLGLSGLNLGALR